MLPAEEKKFCAFLEWSASIKNSRTEVQFLDEIKKHFDHLEIRSDFEGNKPGIKSDVQYCEAKYKSIVNMYTYNSNALVPGHGWYCQFVKRNEVEILRHTLPSLKKKLLHHLEATYERARNNCLEKNVKYNSRNLYLCTTSAFNITSNRYVSMMVSCKT